ncbi:MAG: hypothetical protein EOL98_15425, partial [Negativicutes bacterium]|nr:hypothetical protein [Negativicutes bacterium]
MKKKLTLIFVLAIAAVTSYSQPFAKNDHLASLQIGLGGNIYNDYNYHMLIPPMGLQYEVIITDMIGIGNIGVGGYGLFSARIYDFNNADYTNTRYHITVGARGYYHFALADFMDDPVFNKV